MQPADSSAAESYHESNRRRQNNRTDRKRCQSREQLCMVCKEVKCCKYDVQRGSTDRRYVCAEACLQRFKRDPQAFVSSMDEMETVPDSFQDVITHGDLMIPECCGVCGKYLDYERKPKFVPRFYGPQLQGTCSAECFARLQNLHSLRFACHECQVLFSPSLADLQKPCISWNLLKYCSPRCLVQTVDSRLSRTQGCQGFCLTCRTLINPSRTMPQLSTMHIIALGAGLKQFCSESCLMEFVLNAATCQVCEAVVNQGEFLTYDVSGQPDQQLTFCSSACLSHFLNTGMGDPKIQLVENISDADALPPSDERCDICSCCEHQPASIVLRVETLDAGPTGVPGGSGSLYADRSVHSTINVCTERCMYAGLSSKNLAPLLCSCCGPFASPWPPLYSRFLLTPSTDGVAGGGPETTNVAIFCGKTCSAKWSMTHQHELIPCSQCPQASRPIQFMIIASFGNAGGQRAFCSAQCLTVYIGSETSAVVVSNGFEDPVLDAAATLMYGEEMLTNATTSSASPLMAADSLDQSMIDWRPEQNVDTMPNSDSEYHANYGNSEETVETEQKPSLFASGMDHAESLISHPDHSSAIPVTVVEADPNQATISRLSLVNCSVQTDLAESDTTSIAETNASAMLAAGQKEILREQRHFRSELCQLRTQLYQLMDQLKANNSNSADDSTVITQSQSVPIPVMSERSRLAPSDSITERTSLANGDIGTSLPLRSVHSMHGRTDSPGTDLIALGAMPEYSLSVSKYMEILNESEAVTDFVLRLVGCFMDGNTLARCGSFEALQAEQPVFPAILAQGKFQFENFEQALPDICTAINVMCQACRTAD